MFRLHDIKKEEKEERERGGKGNIDFIGFVEEGDQFSIGDRSHTNQSLDRRREKKGRRHTYRQEMLSLQRGILLQNSLASRGGCVT